MAVQRGWIPVDRVAQRHRSRLAGRNLRVSPDGEVHRVRETVWLQGERIPAPRCGTGTSVLDPGRWEATTDAVSCLLCYRTDEAPPMPSTVPPRQLELFPADDAQPARIEARS